MHNPPRILSIEDEATVRRGMAAYLTDSGYEVIEAENGRIGLQRVLLDEPDLILCDLRMPELDGMRVLSEVRRLVPELPFIIVSGSGEMIDAIEALRLGAWDYLLKPIEDMGILEHAVKRALDQARLIQQNRKYREDLVATNRRLQQSLQQLEEDETAARYIQFQLLPQRSTVLNGVLFDYFLRTSAFLSGDFLDYFKINDAQTGFYVADVSGHGVSSAFVTVLLKNTVSHLIDEYREFKNDTILDPGRVLKLLNDRILARKFDKHLTMFFAVIDTGQQVMRYGNAGHFPYPVFHDGQSAHFLADTHLPVGMFEDWTYASKTLTLPESFALAIFSDGVFEVFPAHRLLDKENRLLSLMEPCVPDIETAVDALGLARPGQVPDDISVLLLKKGG